MTVKRPNNSLKARLVGGVRPVTEPDEAEALEADAGEAGDDGIVDLPAIMMSSTRRKPAAVPQAAEHLPHWREKVPNLIEPELDVDEAQDDAVAAQDADDPSILQDDITELPQGLSRDPERDLGKDRKRAGTETSQPDDAAPGSQTVPGPAVAAPSPLSRFKRQTSEPDAVEYKQEEASQTRSRPSPIVPRATMAGRALTLVVAIMGFLACLTVGALTILYDATDDWQSDIARQVTIQVEPTAGIDMDEALTQAVAIARSWPGVASATALSDAETRQLLEPWLGSGLDIDELPVPRLVRVELADRSAFNPVAAQDGLLALSADATLDDHQRWTDRLSTMASAAFWIGVLVFGLVLTAMVLSVTFATRSAMAANRGVIEVLHLVGAENSFIASQFQSHFLVLGLKGGCVGGAAAVLSLFVASFAIGRTQGTAVADQVSALTGGFSLGIQAVIGAVLVVILIAAITALTSRLTVHRFVSETR